MKYFDLHCDTISECFNQKVSLLKNELQLNLEKGSSLSDWVQVYAIWISDEFNDDAAYQYFNDVHQYFISQIEEQNEIIKFCEESKQMVKALDDKKKVALLAIEGSRALGGKIERVQEFYDKGVRFMTLTWNGRTKVADGCMVEKAAGLTPFGNKVVTKMNELGMIVDVSHLAEKGFWDVARLSSRPFIATHSNSKSLCDHPRNLTDEQFKEIIKRKGIVGMNYFPVFINGTYEAEIKELLPHIDHFIELGGEEVIAMGSDFDGAKMPKDIKGIQDVSSLYQLLVKRYGKSRADQFIFDNANRFCCENL